MLIDSQFTSPGRLRALDTNTVLIARAKNVLTLRYGIDSYEALAVLVHWARVTRTPVHSVADTLMHGIREVNPQVGARQAPLIRWLEAQFRDGDPHLTRLPATPVWPRASA